MTGPTITDLERLRARLLELTRRKTSSLVVADELGLITHVDVALASALGWLAEELVGRPLTTIIPPRFRDAHHIGFSRFLSTHQPMLLDRLLTMSVVNRSGDELAAEHVITAVPVANGWWFAAAIRLEHHGE